MLKQLLLSSIIAVSLLTTVFADMININKADIVTLAENLKGIGVKKAKAIVDYREENGSFSTIDDITNVKGIGAKTLEKNREFMSTEEKNEVNQSEELTATSEEQKVNSAVEKIEKEAKAEQKVKK